MGKTSITLRALLEVKKAGYKKTLIIAPLRVIYSSWPDELTQWDDFKGLRFEIYHGRDPEGIRFSNADIILVNFDYVAKMLRACTAETFCDYYRIGGIVIDELTAYKSTNSQRYRGMRRIVPQAAFRWGLTGSPVANRLIDIFGQAYILDLGATFGPYITHFRNKYFRPTGYGGYKFELQNDEARDAIYAGIGKLGLRLSAEEYLDMPECIENKIRVELPESVMKVYRDMEKEMVAVIEDKVQSAPSKAAALNKCRQIASGSVYMTQDMLSDEVSFERTKQLHEAKGDALETLFDELNGKQLLVYVGFRSEAAYLQRRFGAECVMGGTNVEHSRRIINDWNTGSVGMLVAHPASLGHGVNLQHGGSHVCWYTLTWDYEQYDQCVRRLLRQGQKSSVFVHKLIVPKTIDTYVNKVLSAKAQGQADVFDFIRREYYAAS